MAVARAYLFVFFFSVFLIVSWKFSVIGVKDAVRLAGRGLLLLSVLTWMSSCLYPRLRSYLCPATPLPVEGPAEDAHSRFKQEKARREQQHQHSAKSEKYLEAVVKPRQEAVLRKAEEDFYRMTGQSWKLSQGFTLGGEEQMMANTDGDDETPSQRAARKRKELEAPNPAPVQTRLPNVKKIITLPDEPAEDANGVVKIALRCPSGRTVRRRFLKTCRSTVLLDWLHKSGYSPTLYALYTSYPRGPLLTRTDLSMEDVGIITHTTLNVEEKDPSTS
ncbi:UBX domain-containing protein 8 isoform X2 [Pangasianodon hypophthalmus]|uniref:UBX domain-containing protein 8 isoform X2 n=1 Tax=Pangasianodon hypophthalmus TaxID=310915 RepID=UPI000EFF7759|nr:UBX domain-containing protein 8 isoform X2 [Pangasianodon hypophthalmus]